MLREAKSVFEFLAAQKLTAAEIVAMLRHDLTISDAVRTRLGLGGARAAGEPSEPLVEGMTIVRPARYVGLSQRSRMEPQTPWSFRSG